MHHLARQKAKASGYFLQNKSLIANQIHLWSDKYFSELLILSEIAGAFLVLGVFRGKKGEAEVIR